VYKYKNKYPYLYTRKWKGGGEGIGGEDTTIRVFAPHHIFYHHIFYEVCGDGEIKKKLD
jgi:hypothetical protein